MLTQSFIEKLWKKFPFVGSWKRVEVKHKASVIFYSERATSVNEFYVCMYVHIYVHMCVWMHACMYICMYRNTEVYSV